MNDSNPKTAGTADTSPIDPDKPAEKLEPLSQGQLHENESSSQRARQPDAWHALQKLTPARIALGRSGISLPTRELLTFSQAHALARDAVHTELDWTLVHSQLKKLGLPVLAVQSAAKDRAAYLARPDWGRLLAPDTQLPEEPLGQDVLIVVSDGLSAQAIHRHAYGVIEALLPLLAPLSIGPIVVARQARVAIADAIGHRMRAGLSINLIGERPGLSAPDSLGAYITHQPKPGLKDAQRNCISNIRPEGLPYGLAAKQIASLVHTAFELGGTGVAIANEIRRRLASPSD